MVYYRYLYKMSMWSCLASEGWKSANETESVWKGCRINNASYSLPYAAFTVGYVSHKQYIWMNGCKITQCNDSFVFSTRGGQPFGLQIQESTDTWAPPRVKITWIWATICADWLGEWPISVQSLGQLVTSCFELTNRRNESEVALTNYIHQAFVRQRYT